MLVKLENIRMNPFRNLEEYPVLREKIDRHKENILRDGFWKNSVLAREKPGEEGTFELAFGTHRYHALKELNEEYPNSGYDVMSLVIDNMDDETIQNRMIKENEESTFDDGVVLTKMLSVETAKNLIETAVRESGGNYEDLPDRVKEAFKNEIGFLTSLGKGTSRKNSGRYRVGVDVLQRYLGRDWNEKHITDILKFINPKSAEITYVEGEDAIRPIYKNVVATAEKMSHAKALADVFQEAEVHMIFPTEEEQLQLLSTIKAEREERIHAGEAVSATTASSLQKTIMEKAVAKLNKDTVEIPKEKRKGNYYKEEENDEIEEILRDKEDASLGEDYAEEYKNEDEPTTEDLASIEKEEESKIEEWQSLEDMLKDIEDKKKALVRHNNYLQSFATNFSQNVLDPYDILEYPEHMAYRNYCYLMKGILTELATARKFEQKFGFISILDTRVYGALDAETEEEYEIVKAYLGDATKETGELPPVEEWCEADIEGLLDGLSSEIEAFKRKRHGPKKPISYNELWDSVKNDEKYQKEHADDWKLERKKKYGV